MNKYNILGLMYAAKQLIIGQDAVIAAIRSNRVKYVLISTTSSQRTQKTIIDKCTYYNIKFSLIDDKGEIAKAIGKKTIMIVATNSEGFAKKMEQIKGE